MATVPPLEHSATNAVLSFDTSNMDVDSVIIHQIASRGADKKIEAPILATKLLNLASAGKDALQKRLTTALGSKSHGVEMSIEEVGAGSFFQGAADAVFATTEEFVASSANMARMLTDAQGPTNAPPGMLAIITGKVGSSSKRFLAVIKADVHDGFGSSGSSTNVEVQYLDQLLLTPTQKLYKAALLLENNPGARIANGGYHASNYRAFLYDHLITATETSAAAAYFYQAFLGMDIQKSARKLTQNFFNYTRDFIDRSNMDDADKIAVKEALRVELRSNNATINAHEFGKAHLPNELRKPYIEHLTGNGFPKNAVVKDTAYVKARLRRPKSYTFGDGIRLLVPADAAEGSVRILNSNTQLTTIEINSGYELKE